MICQATKALNPEETGFPKALNAWKECSKPELQLPDTAGVLPDPVGEGTHFKVPWLQMPNIMDIRTRPRTISSVTGTKGDAPSVSAERSMWHSRYETGTLRFTAVLPTFQEVCVVATSESPVLIIRLQDK